MPHLPEQVVEKGPTAVAQMDPLTNNGRIRQHPVESRIGQRAERHAFDGVQRLLR